MVPVCVTEIFCPSKLILATRVGPAFDVKEKLTTPFVTSVTVSHDWSLVGANGGRRFSARRQHRRATNRFRRTHLRSSESGPRTRAAIPRLNHWKAAGHKDFQLRPLLIFVSARPILKVPTLWTTLLAADHLYKVGCSAVVEL